MLEGMEKMITLICATITNYVHAIHWTTPNSLPSTSTNVNAVLSATLETNVSYEAVTESFTPIDNPSGS